MITPRGAAPGLAPVGAAPSLLACSGAEVHGVSVSALLTA
jgi:hypothetical protein